MLKGELKRRQRIALFALLSPILLIALVVCFYILPEEKQKKTPTKPKIELPGDDVSLQESWNMKTGDQIALIDDKVNYIEGVIIQSKENEAKSFEEKAKLLSKIENLEKKLEQAIENRVVQPQPNPEINHFQDPFSQGTKQYEIQEESRKGLVIKKVEFSRDLVKNVEKTIPAGTTVKAVLVSSVDAPCGAYSSSDPQPVKLQILDDGHLPKNVRARLKGGIIIASAYGDLSSERLILRIERLTQVKSSGDFVETLVTGFVTGEDGKYGIRGSIVDRSEKLVQNAAISGVFSGANSFFQAYAASRWGPYCGFGCGPGYCTDTDCSFDPKEFAYGLAAQGGTEGVGNAFDTLTDYYIRRAELIRPVIQVNAGRIVDITFTLGTEIGDIHAKERCEKIRTKTRSGNA